MGAVWSPVRHCCRYAVVFAAAMSVVFVFGVAAAGEPAEIESTDESGTEWTFGAGAGVQEVASRDFRGAPFAYRGWGYPLDLRFEGVGSRWSATVELGGFASAVNGGELSVESAEGINYAHARTAFVDLGVRLLRAVAIPGQHRLSGGLQLSHWTFYRSYEYDPRQIGSVETWDALVTLDVRGELRRQIGNWQWGVGAGTAVAGRVMRPSYALRGDERIALIEHPGRIFAYGRWATINQLQLLRADAAVSRSIGDRWAVRADYRFGWMAHRDDSRAFTQRLSVGAEFRWGGR